MATLTEKEITVKGTGSNIELYAEYRDGKIDRAYALLEIDGVHMGNSPGPLVYDYGKFTSFCLALMGTLEAELSREFYKELNKLINEGK